MNEEAYKLFLPSSIAFCNLIHKNISQLNPHTATNTQGSKPTYLVLKTKISPRTPGGWEWRMRSETEITAFMAFFREMDSIWGVRGRVISRSAVVEGSNNLDKPVQLYPIAPWLVATLPRSVPIFGHEKNSVFLPAEGLIDWWILVGLSIEILVFESISTQ